MPPVGALCLTYEALDAATDSLAGALYYGPDEIGDCQKFTAGLAAHCAEIGIKFEHGVNIRALTRKGARIEATQTDQGAFQGDAIIAALGNYTPLL